MRFGVLGPLEIVDDAGSIVTVRASKQRAMLAVLLCNRDSAVSVDRLLEALWPDGQVPQSARTNIQVYIHRLRAALGGSRIVHDVAGYRLVVEPDEVDDTRFERLTDDARHRLEAADADGASAVLAEALALWRGVPYAGLDDIEATQVEAVRLEQLYQSALETKIEADLVLGRHGRLVTDLTALVAEYPLNEGFRRQLMIALYRSGRPADALATFREARQLSVDELGLEPGPALRAVEQAVIDGDLEPAETHREPAADQRTYLVPAQLPRAHRAFTGREEEVRQLSAWLSRADGPGVVAVDGPGGIGKSALALHVAHTMIENFPDGQLYVNLHGSTPGAVPTSPQDALVRLLRSLGLDGTSIPEDLDEAAATFRSIAASRRLLIVLDNVAEPAQARPLLPGGGSPSAAVITSRAVLASLDDADHVHLDELSDDESVRLLTRLAGPERVAREPAPAREIVRLCGRLPLAIRIAAARLTARPDWRLATLQSRLQNEAARLDELAHADLAVRASCAVSFGQLSDDDAGLFAGLGILDLPDFTAPSVAALVDRPVPAVRASLDRLVDAQLVIADQDDRYTLHDLVRLFAREIAAQEITEAEHGEAIRRVMLHYVATARQAARLLAPRRDYRLEVGVDDEELTGHLAHFADGDAAASWIRAEAANLVAAIQDTQRHDRVPPEVVIALAAALPHALHSQGLWSEQLAVNTVQIRAAEASGDPMLEALAHKDAGMILAILGRAGAEDHLRRALALYRRAGHRHGEALTLDSLGNVANLSGDPDDGTRYHTEALEAFRELDDHQGVARTLNNLAWGLETSGHPDEAVVRYEESLRMRDQLGDVLGKAVTLLNLGTCRLGMDKFVEAAEAFADAAQVFHNTGDSRRHALAVWKLGIAMSGQGHAEAARDRWRESLDLICRLDLISADDAERIMAAPVPEQPEALRES
ncbi:MAG TPA: BTAD domain-containing putative transcriptional regulator [Jiangellaceae bacterium]